MDKIAQNKRQSNFELLRIISILMIITHHYAYYINTDCKVMGLSLNNIVIDFLFIGGKIGVTIFVLLAGYFGIKSEFRIKKLLKLLLEILFYSVIFLFIDILTKGVNNISIKTVIKSMFPVTFSLYWFATTYIIVYILSPFINKLINCLNKVELKKLLIILIILTYILPTILKQSYGFGNVAIFITLYIIGAYIRLQYNKKSKIKFLIYFILSIIFIFGMQILCEYRLNEEYINYFAKFNNIMVLLSSVSLFMYFKSIKIHNRAINIIASTTFGVYLIHSNYLAHKFIWGSLFDCSKYYIANDYRIIIHAIISIILTYVVCTVIDLFRIYCIEKSVLPIIYKLGNNILTKKEER